MPKKATAALSGAENGDSVSIRVGGGLIRRYTDSFVGIMLRKVLPHVLSVLAGGGAVKMWTDNQSPVHNTQPVSVYAPRNSESESRLRIRVESLEAERTEVHKEITETHKDINDMRKEMGYMAGQVNLLLALEMRKKTKGE